MKQWTTGRLARPVWAVVGLMLAAAAVQAQSPGEALYLQHCAVCHQPDGKGVPGFFPPLAGNPRVTAEDPDQVQVYLGRVVFGHHGGLIVDKQVYSGTMPPIGYVGRVNDSELLDLINYQRQAWGNDARPVTFEELAKARAAGRR
ncbi:MAG: c-type cytochrome [Pseudomonadota bacterium]|jgi:cytochrome c oxidase cbb3-type subunit 2